jgi:UPF0716 family protein affecting phage T7 exclusion
MIAPSLHPETVRAACRSHGRMAFGLTTRTIFLLAAGLLLALPGFFDARLGYGMLVWDALVILAVVLDGLRLPAPQLIAVERISRQRNRDRARRRAARQHHFGMPPHRRPA